MPYYSFKCSAPDCKDRIIDINLPIADRNVIQFCPACGDEMHRVPTMITVLGMDQYGRSGRNGNAK